MFWSEVFLFAPWGEVLGSCTEWMFFKLSLHVFIRTSKITVIVLMVFGGPHSGNCLDFRSWGTAFVGKVSYFLRTTASSTVRFLVW